MKIEKTLKHVLAIAAVAWAAGPAFAQDTPVGLWKTIDDDGKTVKTLIRITESAGVLSGVIEKLLDPKAATVCEKCTGERKDKPVVGMTIIRGIKRNADDTTLWDGGEVLDPENGSTYRLRLRPAEGGKKLEVRGFIGAPLFGRSQTWVRAE
ncbi:MAG: hypothetical protein A2W72_07280 [Burkholderiales bacterium RIFCSPLOWO2_12_67_14]|jgi:uncharacterized protein (DUF2147 family)|nr:MAG: hypothetical protein A3I64_18280 [Burkholderiales bacterium RIFCSPLOWO2_02_FULL_67_64]OGB49366.1 MAG: hypothetical protein A2W72_07280 [Burkholderiales bacterium RIFCSPLOWO2_12_67_14]OGB77299.1 MAG: hypothetical protein A3G82_20365 [Burkholderiales bacterium RIFCSPLOWO2_12_FULL_67_210]